MTLLFHCSCTFAVPNSAVPNRSQLISHFVRCACSLFSELLSQGSWGKLTAEGLALACENSAGVDSEEILKAAWTDPDEDCQALVEACLQAMVLGGCAMLFKIRCKHRFGQRAGGNHQPGRYHTDSTRQLTTNSPHRFTTPFHHTSSPHRSIS